MADDDQYASGRGSSDMTGTDGEGKLTLTTAGPVSSGHDVAFDAVVAYSERLAHDANNYIGAIMGLSEVLPAISDDPEQVNVIASRIAAAARLLQVIVNQALLPVSRGYETPALEMSVARETVMGLSRHLVGPRIGFTLVPNESETALALTQGEFSILLFILLRNACDAADTSEGSAPHIRVALEDVSAAQMAREARDHTFMRGTLPDGDAVALRVFDNGNGLIDQLKANAASVFLPFVSHSKRKSALGLGLTFAVAIVERRGGALGLAQHEETCFTAYLPVNRRASATRDAHAADDEAQPQVLIVDPLMQWGAATATLLGLLDWPALQVGTVGEAVALLDVATRARHVVVIRVPRDGFSRDDAVALDAAFARRFNVDLLLVVGSVQAMAADDQTALTLANLAAMPLQSDAAPADIVNYLIPNI